MNSKSTNKETKNLIDEKNLLIKEYEDRVKKLSELKQQITMINQEKEDIENELNIVRSQIKFINLKENFYKNKAKKLLVQKDFLIKQIDVSLEIMNNEYNKLQDQDHQKDFMISVRKSNKNIQEVYFSGINNLKYFKEVVDFMNVNEFLTINKIVSVEDSSPSDKDKQMDSKSHNTSFVTQDDKIGDESKDFDQDQHTEDKLNNSNIIEKIDIESMKMRKHTTTQNVIDKIRFTNREKPEVDAFNITEPTQFKKDVEFYFTHYCQEMLNCMSNIVCSLYEVADYELPMSLIELLYIVKERSDNDLALEISQKFFNSSKEEVEKKYKEDKEKLEKLERQKANLIKELNDKRKEISRLTKNDENKSHEESESITDRSSDIKTPRSEDMVTIERLNKKKEDLEEKLKEHK